MVMNSKRPAPTSESAMAAKTAKTAKTSGFLIDLTLHEDGDGSSDEDKPKKIFDISPDTMTQSKQRYLVKYLLLRCVGKGFRLRFESS